LLEHLGSIGAAPADGAPGVLRENARADFGVPKNFDLLALCIISDAGEAHRRQLGSGIIYSLDEPGPAAYLDKVAGFRS
jgi:hypothetical protein